VTLVRVAVTAALLGSLLLTPATAQVRKVQDRPDQEPIVFMADELRVDQDLSLVVAKGNVEIAQGRRRVLADTVTYNQRTDMITAAGNVSLLEPTGEVIFANYVELTDQMNDAFAREIRMIMTDRARLAGNTGRRTGGNRTELRKGVYSPCDLCREDPTRAPTWQLKAGSVVHDETQKTIEYRDAVLEFDGIPVLYTPYLSHPDPTVKRLSGFLPPILGNSTNLGFNATVPYFWAISRDKDFTFAPIFTTEAGTVAAGEYRQRFSFGDLNVRGSIVDDFIPTTTPTGGTGTREGVRAHIAANGRFDIDETWRSGFDVNRATDQTYLRKYRYGGYETALISRGFVEGFQPRSYLTAQAYSFYPLRAFQDPDQQPIVLPVMDYNWVGQPDGWGGRWALDANVQNLWRADGSDASRTSLGTEWRLPLFGPLGTAWTFTAGVRGDAYRIGDFVEPDGSEKNGFEGRVYPQVALEARWPFIRRAGNFTQLIEPIVGVYAAPNGLNHSDQIPNDDSVSFDYSENHLFVRDRFSGFDRVDDGQRVDYGLRAAVHGDGGGYSQVIIGQSYRLQSSTPFPAGAGLDDRVSDVVGRLTVSPIDGIAFLYRFRLDHQDLSVERQEAAIGFGPENLRVSLGYLDLPPIQGEIERREQIEAAVALGLTRYWRLALSTTRDLTGSETGTLNSAAHAVYQDECLAFTITVAQTGTQDRDVAPGTTIFFSIALKNLGELVTASYGGPSSR
jgi:LPS-assembly protein